MLGRDASAPTLADSPRRMGAGHRQPRAWTCRRRLIHALLPLYMATVMGASTLRHRRASRASPKSTALIVKLFSRRPVRLVSQAQAARAAGLRHARRHQSFPLATDVSLAQSPGVFRRCAIASRTREQVGGEQRDALIAGQLPSPSTMPQASRRGSDLRPPCDAHLDVGMPRLESPRRG